MGREASELERNPALVAELADRMSRDAVLFADEMVKVGAAQSSFDEAPRRRIQELAPRLGLWLVRSDTRFGGGDLAATCPAQWRMNSPHAYSDILRQGRHMGFGIQTTLMMQGNHAARAQTPEAREVAVLRNGSIHLVVHHSHDSKPHSVVETFSGNTPPDHFTAPEAFTDPELMEVAYAEWCDSLQQARARYTTKF